MLGVGLATEAAGGGVAWDMLHVSTCQSDCGGPLWSSSFYKYISWTGLAFVHTGAVANDGQFSQESGTIGSVEACRQSVAGPRVCYVIKDPGGFSLCCFPN